jgi:quercetin dioxygenase-like cupin family protein
MADFSQMHAALWSFNFDIHKCINYFLEENGFEWAVVFKDKPWFQLASHYHPSDDYLYMLDGELILEISGEVKSFTKWDFIVVPKNVIHSVLPSNGSKYLVAVKDGNFETIFE